ncbi:hypothetical protein [Phaeobacter sp. 11ANDIMAR09]|uniref:hypothetical protein n=1 Tax=Phaeobacter sp. 11ANDIMAR09 TaxID=1225647 RepID=UPI0006C882E5|nr:hypothetical protein [Phaeobacter sp. 11ANDIMAR09]KPD10242.1 hypothetical protein AN476_22110 [Phaeobacter sp. 11ANDIMAR09]
MAKFFKPRSVKNNAVNHRIAEQLWLEVARITGRLDGDIPAFMSESPRGIQLSERHKTDGVSVYIRELENPHRVLAYPVSHKKLRASLTSDTRLDWSALAKVVETGRAIVVAGGDIRIESSSIDISRAKKDPEYLEMVSRQQEVTDRFGPLFREPDKLTEASFRGFLFFEHNHHWTSLYRQTSNLLEQGFVHLQKTIAILTDEGRSVGVRYDEAVGGQKGMSKGIATAIMMVAYPNKYGVWNSKSEAGLTELGVWPDLPQGASDGEKYEAINGILHTLCATYDVDLWSLDGLLHFILHPTGDQSATPPSVDTSGQNVRDSDDDDVFDKVAKRILATVAASGTTSERTAKEKPTDMTHAELVAYIEELFQEQDGKCKLTGIPMEVTLGGPLAISPDRIDSNAGYVRGNIQLTVWAANKAKGDTPDAEFREFIDRVRAVK